MKRINLVYYDYETLFRELNVKFLKILRGIIMYKLELMINAFTL